MKKIASLLLAALFLLLPVSPAYAFPGDSQALPFEDVKDQDWFREAVGYVYAQDLFSGVSSKRFDPNGIMTRAMFVTVLVNLSGADTSSYDGQHFADVEPGQWYAKNIEFAALHSIVSGSGQFRFRPNDGITREDMATLLRRFAQATGNDISPAPFPSHFSDSDQVSAYAQEAVSWAVDKGLIKGTSSTTLSPKSTLTRAQAAQVFYNARNVFLSTEILTGPTELPEPDTIERMVCNMTLEEKVGQLFLPRYPAANPEALTQRLAPAGYTLYAKDFQGKTQDQVQDMAEHLQSVSKVPLFIAVDEEGGTVVRVSSNPNLADKPFQSPQSIYKSQGEEGIVADTEEKSALLLDLGINLNLAPVCDISINPNDYIYSRSLGVPGEEAASVIAAMVKAMGRSGISSTLKHFPGYGNNQNTHTGISVDERPYEQFVSEDFLPFAAGIQAGAPSVLVSHNIVTAMDPDRPASLSPAVHQVLREELGFQGAILTDDLSMDAIKLYTGGQSPAVAAFLAGNDLLLTSNWEADYQALLAAAQSGKVHVEDIEASVRRILTWKETKGLLS